METYRKARIYAPTINNIGVLAPILLKRGLLFETCAEAIECLRAADPHDPLLDDEGELRHLIERVHAGATLVWPESGPGFVPRYFFGRDGLLYPEGGDFGDGVWPLSEPPQEIGSLLLPLMTEEARAADRAAESARQADLDREAELTAAAVALGWPAPVRA